MSAALHAIIVDFLAADGAKEQSSTSRSIQRTIRHLRDGLLWQGYLLLLLEKLFACHPSPHQIVR